MTDSFYLKNEGILTKYAHANIDFYWGPWTSVNNDQDNTSAFTNIPVGKRIKGLKFGVVNAITGDIEEYMFTKDNATDNDIIKLVLSSDDVTGTYDYTIGRTTSEQLSEAIGANKIITIGTYIASVGRVGTSSSGYYVVCYTDEDGVFHKIVHGTSTSSVGTETTKEFAEVETINSISELGLSGVIGGIKKYQGNTMLDLGGVSGSGTLGNAIKHLISLGVHVDADKTNNVFSIKNINNETIGSITLGTNATNGAAELNFVAGSNQFTATLPNLDYDSSRQMLKYIDAGGDDHDLIRLSNLQIKTVFDHNTYEGDAPTSVAHDAYAVGDLALVEKQDTTTTPATVYYDLTVVQSVTAGTPNDTIQWQPLGSINNVSLVADQVAFTPNSGLSATTVQGAIEEVNIIGDNNSEADLDITDDDGYVLGRFGGGHIQTKNFDSRDIDKIKQNTGIEEYNSFDETENYAIGDIVLYNGLLYKFVSAHTGAWSQNDVVQTSIKSPVKIEESYADYEVSDGNGYSILKVEEGHIKTKNFDSSNINVEPTQKESPLLSLRNVQLRANLFRTIPWVAKSSIASTPDPQGDIEAGTHIGLPYTSCMEVDKFVGFDVSLRTFMTCANNPYSLLYTENLRGTPGTSGYGFTYHGSRDTIGGYMGIVCNVFALHSVGAIIPYDTPAWEWAALNGIWTKPANQTASGVRVGDLIWKQGHGHVITGVTKDSDGNVTYVTYEESIMDFPSSTTLSASAFNSFMSGKVLYRISNLRNVEFEDWDSEYEYNNDICTFAGDYACFRVGQPIFLNYNLNGNDNGWTHIELAKMSGTIIGTYEISSNTDVHRYELTSLNLPYGKYKARMKKTENGVVSYSKYCHFECVEANAVWKTTNGITRVVFSSMNGAPLYIRWCTIDGGPLGLYALTDKDIENGYADVDVNSLITGQGKSFISNGTYIKVGFVGEYGRVTTVPTLFSLS